MNEARFFHGCAVFNNKNGDMQLVVTGGIGFGPPMSSVEISTYDSDLDDWSSFVKTDALPGWRYYHKTCLLYTSDAADE